MATHTDTATIEAAADTEHEAPAPQCDLVMKGGITSGVVYPKAAVALSTKYQFRRIGGSSAGAIAAVLTAAAEYQRVTGAKNSHDEPGFARLEGLADRLQTELFTLFQPSPRTRGVFRFLIAWLEPGVPMPLRVALAILRLILGAFFTFAVTTVVLLLPWFATAAALLGGLDGVRFDRALGSLKVWLLPALMGGLIAATARLAVKAVGDLNDNGFGLCKGHETDDGPALTDWMAREINITAGLAVPTFDAVGNPPLAGPPPLTFGDLWGSDAIAEFNSHLWVPGAKPPVDPNIFDPGLKFKGAIPAIRWESFDPQIDLRVMTTCLTQQVPRVFPFWDDVYLYCPECLSEYFPTWVMDHLATYSRDPGTTNAAGQRGWSLSDRQPEPEPGSDDDPAAPADQPTPADLAAPEGHWVPALCPRDDHELRKLPLARDIPIVVAARLSLSFPILISAVPLYYLDHFQARVITAWFSDGGITSNFPMQFFDNWLPVRPSFGINLEDFDPRYAAAGETVILPPADSRDRILHETPLTGVFGFLASAVMTMHGWPDRLQMEAPGFRDRIVTVYTEANEGGLNLKMSTADIERLSGKGEIAGMKLRDDFSPDVHRWIRFRIAMNGISLGLARFRKGWTAFKRDVPVHPVDAPYDRVREQAVRGEAEQLSEQAVAWQKDKWPATIRSPRPEPELRFGSAPR